MRTVPSQRTLRRLATGAASVAVLVVLASCGGHDDGGAPPPVATTPSNTPPASASADVAGFIAYLKVLVATRQDTAEPLDVAAFVAPVSDTTEPDPSI